MYEKAKSQTDKLLQARRKNAKQYWQMLKETAGLPKSSTISADSFVQYFKAINNPTDPFFQPDEDIIHFNEVYFESEIRIMFSELNTEISNDEILQSISQLSNGRSGGPDMFLNEFLIHGKVYILPFLHRLFNVTFKNGYFPDSWSVGYIVPLHKKGNVNDVGNYRGITLLSTIGKLFSRILNNRLTNWGEKYFVYVESQAGFRKHMSTVDHVFILNGVITHLLSQGKQLHCAFVDFTKAFDYIVRENIWYKLIRMGIRGNMLNVIKSMYDNIKSKVKFNNQLSEEFTCMLGVRQGECLSPFIFAMYINDLEDEFYLNGIEGIDIGMIRILLLMYADDIAILATSAENLQKGLDTLYNYCQRWKLTVNTNKTKIMIFRKGGRLPTNLKFYYNNSEIEIVTKFSYLGIVFTPGGSFSEANNTLSGQAQKAIFKLNTYLRKFTDLSLKHTIDLFDKLVLPILNYAGEVWGFSQSLQVERVHLHFCKRLLDVKITTQNDFIYGELGRISLRTGRLYNIIKYWFKIIGSSDRKYIKCIYNMMLQDLEGTPTTRNWASLVKCMLTELGFYHVWLSQGVGDIPHFLTLFKQRLKDNFIQDWNARINESSRALFYRNISSFEYQCYLDFITVKQFRVALTRLRVSSHRLEVEAGRWHKPVSTPFDNRKCQFCNVLEDEFHFLFICPVYNDLRVNYVCRYYRTRPSMLKLISLFHSDRKTYIRNLGIFIFKAFEERKDIISQLNRYV